MISSFCHQGGCVEVLPGDVGMVRVRDSADPETELVFTVEEWDAFLAGIKAGEFDFPLFDV